MRSEGPPLERLLRRLAECPPDFLPTLPVREELPVRVAAVVADLARDLGGRAPEQRRLEYFARLQLKGTGAGQRNQTLLVLIACWLLHDDWFRQGRFSEQALLFLERGLGDLARLVQAARFVDDPDRREELARAALLALGLRPSGETPAQARDRLATLDSVERAAVLEKTRAAEERAREVREAMARKAAQEAAASYGRE